MNTPQKMEDLRHVETCLTLDERIAAVNESKLLRAIRALGDRWLLSPNYSGHYRPELRPGGRAHAKRSPSITIASRLVAVPTHAPPELHRS
jgi:hypothetical protein